MELQTATYYPATALAGDGVELLTPSGASLTKFAAVVRPAAANVIETFQRDDRADLSPSQLVEAKLAMLTRGAVVPVSHFRHNKTCRRS